MPPLKIEKKIGGYRGKIINRVMKKNYISNVKWIPELLSNVRTMWIIQRMKYIWYRMPQNYQFQKMVSEQNKFQENLETIKAMR